MGREGRRPARAHRRVHMAMPRDGQHLYPGRAWSAHTRQGEVMTDKVAVANPLIGEEERAAVDRVLRSGGLAQGPEVADFESEFSAQVVAHRPCVATNSGTSSLHLGLAAAGVTSGDEVVVPSFTF